MQADARLMKAVEDGTATAESTGVAVRALADQREAEYATKAERSEQKGLLSAWLNAGHGRVLAQYWEARASGDQLRSAEALAVRLEAWTSFHAGN